MAKYSVGQKVFIVDEGKHYSTYYSWASDNKFSLLDDRIRKLWAKYLTTENNDCENGTELTIIAAGCHCCDRNFAMYLCEDAEGNPVLISEPGLAAVEEKAGLKWADLKIGDVLKNKMNGDQYMMITGIDKSDYVPAHIYTGEWLSDKELAGLWEKVEK